MGKIHNDHRIVTVDDKGKIVKNVDSPSFALAKPIFDATEPEEGQTIRLQHGARVIFRKPEGSVH
jgi:hypothetical protein